MKLFKKMKDGGPESPVIGYFLVEIKSLFSIVLLKFGGTREAYHSHAFNAVTLWLKGSVEEKVLVNKDGDISYIRPFKAGQFKYTPRNLMHKILPGAGAWALSIRGPWISRWQEVRSLGPLGGHRLVTLTHGRKEVL